MVVLTAVVFCAAGCGTTISSYNPVSEDSGVPASALFSLGEVEDLSGFQFSPDDTDTFDLAVAMRNALQTELSQNGLLANGSYTLHVNILDYAPGNAFKRWLVPGWGETKLSVKAIIVDERNKKIADIPVEKYVDMGGGYTIGAYKYIFDDVSKEIVSVLNTLKKRGDTERGAI
ncbi:MAG: DUF4410 domain-containing protein [Oxalobacter formigenes]|nr:DUF4410 domain-containing protein [Oxalobacter formigenes]